MKYSCDVVRDLLPLYQDEVCSEDTKKIIIDHLEKCEECRRIGMSMKIDYSLSEPEKRHDRDALKRCFTKIRRRLIIIFVLIILSLPILSLLVRLGINEYRKEGFCYTNIDDYRKAERIVRDIEKGRFEKVFSLIDRHSDYESIVSVLDIDENSPDTSEDDIERKKYVCKMFPAELTMTYEEYRASRTEKAAAVFGKFCENGGSVHFSRCLDIYRIAYGWVFRYRVNLCMNGEEPVTQIWEVIITKDGILFQYSSYSPLQDNSYVEDLTECLC